MAASLGAVMTLAATVKRASSRTLQCATTPTKNAAAIANSQPTAQFAVLQPAPVILLRLVQAPQPRAQQTSQLQTANLAK